MRPDVMSRTIHMRPNIMSRTIYMHHMRMRMRNTFYIRYIWRIWIVRDIIRTHIRDSYSSWYVPVGVPFVHKGDTFYIRCMVLWKGLVREQKSELLWVTTYTYESRTIYMNYIYESWTMHMSHEQCIWVTKYIVPDVRGVSHVREQYSN